MKRLVFAIPLLAAAFSCHRSSDDNAAPVGIDRKLEAPPAAPDLGANGPAAGMPGAALTVAAARPQGELQGVSRPTITFNKPVVALATLEQGDAENPARAFTLEPGDRRAAGTGSAVASVEFVNDAQLAYSSTFKVTVPAGLKALDGSKLAEAYSFSFTTPVINIEQADTDPPELCQWSTPQQPFRVLVNQPLADLAHAFFFEGRGRRPRRRESDRNSGNVSDEQRARRKRPRPIPPSSATSSARLRSSSSSRAR